MANGNDRMTLWLYKNDYRKGEKQPEKTGTGEIPKEVLRQFVDALKASPADVVKVECAGWNRTSKNGRDYLYITVNMPWKAPDADVKDEELPF